MPVEAQLQQAYDHLDSSGPRPTRRRPWIALGGLVLGLGTIASFVGAAAVANSSAQRSRKDFAAAAAQIATNLQLALLHEHDLVVSTEAFFLNRPDATEAAFLRWAANEQALVRYPELEGFGDSRIVTQAELPAFAARSNSTPASGLGSISTFSVIPPGNRPFYCFSAVGLDRSSQVGAPAGFDFCAGAQGRVMLATRDSGLTDLQPITLRKVTTLSLVSPIYRGTAIPSTVAERQATFVGWVGMSIVPNVILQTALSGYPTSAVTLRFTGSSSPVVFRSGSVSASAESLTVDLHNGWTVETAAKVADGGLFSSGNALILLFAGMLLSALLGALIYVLGTGRGAQCSWSTNVPTNCNTRRSTTL